MLTIGPHHRPSAPFPRWTVIALAAVWVGGLALPDVDAILFVGIVPAIAAAVWLEDRVFRALGRRSPFVQLAGFAVLPGAWLVGGMLAAGLFAALGGEALAPALALAGMWLASASIGSAVVWLVDAVAQRLASSFANWVRATVFGVVLGASGLVVVVSMVVPLVIAQAARGAEGLQVSVDGEAVAPGELPTALREAGVPDLLVTSDPERMLGDLLAAALLVLLVPALWSAVSKLGEKATDRIYPLDRAMEHVADGDLAVRVEVGGAAELARLAARFNGMVEALVLARSMETAFGAYVSRPVLERIRAQHGAFELPVSERRATVFFADMRGFTSMSERLAPEQILAVLRRFYAEALEVIGAHEGYVDKFIGDAVYVVFNGPIDQPDHVARGVACAQAIQALVARRNAEGAFPEVGELQVGIGLATGPVIAGNIGTERATQFAVIGDTVNLAARLSGLAPAGEVWVNPTAAEALAGRVPTVALEPVLLKGKQQPVTPHRLGPA